MCSITVFGVVVDGFCEGIVMDEIRSTDLEDLLAELGLFGGQRIDTLIEALREAEVEEEGEDQGYDEN